MVEKKYIKIGIAATAAVALVIGLSVGITQSKARNTSASAMDTPTVDWNDCDLDQGEKVNPRLVDGLGRRRLIVPGTENFKYEETSQRRTLRDSLNNGELLYFS